MNKRLSRALVLALCWAAPGASARAFSCADPPWAPSWSTEVRDAPLDIQPWFQTYCSFAEFLAELVSDCALVADDHTVEVTHELDDAACDEYGDDMLFVRFVPAELLRPSRRYELQCSSGPRIFDFWLETHAGPGLAAPPTVVIAADARHVQGDESCCGDDQLELELADPEPAFLREGGMIEVAYDDGAVYGISAERAHAPVLPPTRGPLILTPVAANGVRGQSTRVGRGEIRAQPIYIACGVRPRSSSLALWLLMPLLWISVHGRRRRRST